MNRREWLALGAALAAPGHAASAVASAAASAVTSAGASSAQPPAAGRPPRTLRLAFNTAETGFDPPRVSDHNSSLVCSAIFEAPLTYDYLARPVRLRPQTAASLPEISADFRTFTFRLRPGIYFAHDPAFNRARGGEGADAQPGRGRELVAQDYVYTVKRYYDPQINSENLYVFENAKLLGLSELRRRAIETRQPFEYDTEVAGIRALDRYAFEVRLAEPSPRFHFQFAIPAVTGAVAREVVEAYGDDISAHPVGTGPFQLAVWRRASRIELQRNPGFREQFFEAHPPDDDAEAQALHAELAGQRLPRADRIEISVITEAQPRWLAFLNGALDTIAVPSEFVPVALPNNTLAPNLARRGMRLQRTPQPDMGMSYFAMEHPLVGGYTPDKVALRRAIALAYDNEEDLRSLRHGQGIVAQSVIAPFTSGHDPAFRSEMGDHSHARAKALLDLHGYIDRDGDGWREQPDGRPLLLRRASLPDQRSRQANELWRKHMNAIGLRMAFDIANWPDLLKMTRTGQLMMWGFNWAAGTPDGGFFLGIAYGPNAAESNDARFALPAYDRLFEQQNVLPDGLERQALMHRCKKLLTAYMPYKANGHSVANDVVQPWLSGFSRHPFMRDTWVFLGVREES